MWAARTCTVRQRLELMCHKGVRSCRSRLTKSDSTAECACILYDVYAEQYVTSNLGPKTIVFKRVSVPQTKPQEEYSAQKAIPRLLC